MATSNSQFKEDKKTIFCFLLFGIFRCCQVHREKKNGKLGVFEVVQSMTF